jgi:heme-degrading monooxygenase HmoA
MPDDTGTEIVTVFRSHLAAEHEEEYRLLAAATEERARNLGGLVEFKSFVAPDGERLSLVIFRDRAAHERWRADELHRSAQRAGWERLYERFEILTCPLEHRITKGERAR